MGLKIIKKIEDYKNFYKDFLYNKKIGFVPTMGALHQGHLSLLKKAKENNDVAIMSIFVNPIQFGENEDFDKYPRTIEKDIFLAEKLGIDIVFYTDENELYPQKQTFFVSSDSIMFTSRLCANTRKNHFKGVATIVTKLFNIIKPNVAYFGQKDYQQFLLIKNMVKELNMDVNIQMCPIIREEDGLAKSSRNIYLKDKERQEATILYKALKLGEKILTSSQDLLDNIKLAKEEIENLINSSKLLKIDYISICNASLLEEITKKDLEKKNSINVLIAIAVYIGNTRLIDNEIVSVKIN